MPSAPDSHSKFKSYYLQVERRTKPPTSALVKVLLPTGGTTNQATNECLGTKFKSYYLRVEGRTKPPTSSIYGWKDEPSHQQVPWSKLKSSNIRVGGQTKPLISVLVKNLSSSTYGWKDELSHLRVPWSKIKVLLPTGGRTNQATSK